jgi:hypothetical protein
MKVYYSNLNKMETRGSLFNFLASYLNERKQLVLLDGYESDWGIIESAVPQGSVIGPLLFLIYISDLEQEMKSKINFFLVIPLCFQ